MNFTLRARYLSACFFGRVTTGPTAAFHNTENAAPNFIRIHLPADDNLVDKLLCSKQQTKICIQHICYIVSYMRWWTTSRCSVSALEYVCSPTENIMLHTKRTRNAVSMETICCRCCEIKSSRSSSSPVLFHIGAQRRTRLLCVKRTQLPSGNCQLTFTPWFNCLPLTFGVD